MRIQRISDIADIPINRQEWNALAAQNETNTPFQTYEWVTSWWSVFGKGHDLFLLLLFEAEKVTGLVPLMIDHKQNRKVLKFIGDVNADYCDFITSNDKVTFTRMFFEYLARTQNKWNALHLRNIPEHSHTSSILEKCSSEIGLPYIKSSAACPVLVTKDIQPGTQWKTSRTLKRHLNHFNKNGNLTFKRFTSLVDAQNSLDSFFEQHIQRWNITTQPSLFYDKRYRDFYHHLLEEAWPAGWLFFSCLQFNQQPIAFHYGFDYNSKVIWYKPSFDINFYKRSPGKLLLKHLIDYCINNNKNEFDFTIGDEPFKKQYTNLVRKNHTLQIFKNKFEYSLHRSTKITKKIAKKILRYNRVPKKCRHHGNNTMKLSLVSQPASNKFHS